MVKLGGYTENMLRRGRQNRSNARVGVGVKLGQHFLRGTWAARALVEAAGISRGSTVLEVGPGKGVLTKEILGVGARVIAIEKDEVLVAFLKERFASEIASGALSVVSDDIRNVLPEKLDLPEEGYIVAANIPYYITGEIIRQFLTAKVQPQRMALLIQKEVAQRITSKRESILSLSVKAYGMPRIAAKVSRGNFSPPPSVDSAILVVENISRKFFDGINEEEFFKIVRAGFSSKRKLLANNLAEKCGLEKAFVLDAFTKCDVQEKARAEEVPLEKWKCLTQQLSGAGFQLSGNSRRHFPDN